MVNQLAVQLESGGKTAEGCCTPPEDKIPQKISIAPRRVLPIIFLPGIMGTNLRMNSERQARLDRANNIAWRPDSIFASKPLLTATAADRQLRLDPDTTEVDIYDPVANKTGDAGETSHERHDIGDVHVYLKVNMDSPLLCDDSPTKKDRKTKTQKAMERGWGEIYFGSYRDILETCEKHLNGITSGKFWKSIFEISPLDWNAVESIPMQALTEKECREAVKGCFFPVHAIGYNWLQSNADSAVNVATRLRAIKEKYQSQGFQCEKFILVTHSMGGLVARALVHPQIAGMEAEVLGIVHGVMPAVGAPSAYKRMRCGFEEGFGNMAIAPKILGNSGDEVTAVLASSPGGLELLPSNAYGRGWLKIYQGGNLLAALPKGDPYTEIYKVRGKWFGLFRDDWINPANIPGKGFDYTSSLLDQAKKFHEKISSSYHPNSYAHYSAEKTRPSWETVVWNLDKKYSGSQWQELIIFSDDGQGEFTVNEKNKGGSKAKFDVELGPSTGPGDQTVCLKSADHQLLSGKFRGVFRQSGYEHQGSYDNKIVIKSTMYSLIKIISTMRWCDDGEI